MVWALLLPAVTIGASLISKNEEYKPSTKEVVSRDNQLFLSGAVMGLGLSYLCLFVSSQFRITERLRLLWFYCTNLDEAHDLTPYRRPTSVLSTTEMLRKTEHGDLKRLLSPKTAATSSLHVSILTLKPNCEIPSQRARGVEFYYVLSGSGAFSQQGVTETFKVVKGDCFVVDCGNMRWINTKDQNDDLRLLRATDGGNRYNNPTFDQIRLDPSQRSKKGASCFMKVLKSSDKLWHNGAS